MNLDLVRAKLHELTNLPVNWDGYGADPIGTDTAERVLEILNEICTDETPQPFLCPGSDGSVQIEWHDEKGGIEIVVENDGQVSASRSSSVFPYEWEDDRDYGPEIAEWIREL